MVKSTGICSAGDPNWMKGAATRRPCRKKPCHRPTMLSPMHPDKRRRRDNMRLMQVITPTCNAHSPWKRLDEIPCNERRRQGHLYFDALCETKSLLPHFISFGPSVS
ncbi:uncharacterized protein Bfra_004436 [Botrytis fragariae]|uniref:Uncharacterized protein n=1 Tax=Botrytis fragariae TaxID=1964551 RepID=A0A8H6AVS5_9HELO|nr:uncharacterized protein Bfra_004436 [Botrytis fragariae]KAF5874429.1 hypothetical protein Bfra_004436 [Botrytis fragariae]